VFTKLAVCVLFTTSAIAQDAPNLERPDVKPGDTWTYRFTAKDVINETSQVVITVDDSTITTETKRSADGAITKVDYPRDWAANSNTFKVFSFPLEVGKKWNSKRSYSTAQCGSMIDDLSAEVKGWEDVVVPAGKFRALRIEHNGTYQSAQCGSGTKQHWYWYVPNVKRHVKYEQHVYPPGGWPIDELVELKAYNVQ
jgi:hypothetical protein